MWFSHSQVPSFLNDCGTRTECSAEGTIAEMPTGSSALPMGRLRQRRILSSPAESGANLHQPQPTFKHFKQLVV